MIIQQILDKLESFGLLRQKKQSGSYMQIYCPFHNDGNESRPSCGVLLTDEYRNGKKYPAGWFHCFTCHYSKNIGEAVNDLLRIKEISDDAAAWIKENIPELEDSGDVEYDHLLPSGMLDALDDNQAALAFMKSLTEKKQEFVSEEELASYRFVVPYMYERKLTDEIIEKFDVGVDANFIPPGRKRKVPCITFPVRDADGNTLFLCRRSIEGKMYHYPEGAVKPLYGLDMLPKDCRSVFICESVINALTLWSWGYCAVALLGTGNSLQMHQLKLLNVNEYVICTDGDEAGRRAADKLKRALKRVAVVWVVPMPDGKDVNDLTREEFEACYADRE